MRESGIVNREINDVLSTLGHTDEMMVCDAGFAIPNGIRTVDISFSENKPTVPEVLEELRRHFSVERVVISADTQEKMPTRFQELAEAFDNVQIDVVPQAELRARAKGVKAIVRTGDFSAFSNVLLVSGGGPRWRVEKP